MNRLRHLFLPSGSIKTCCKNIRSKRNSNEQVGKYRDQCRSGTNRSKCLLTTEMSHDHEIHCIKHQLQDSRQHEWQCKGNQFVHNGTIAHINFVFVFLQRSHFHSNFKICGNHRSSPTSHTMIHKQSALLGAPGDCILHMIKMILCFRMILCICRYDRRRKILFIYRIRIEL